MSKSISILLIFVLCASFLLSANALAQDNEASLRTILTSQCGSDNFYLFSYGDYDGDGTFEAFVLVGDSNDWGGMTGDVWFVSNQHAERLQSGKSYCRLMQLGDTAPILFTAEENYGGSGSTGYLWCVKNGVPTTMDVGLLNGFTYSGSGNEYYAYPDAFDGMDDGTGHTWKQYYFYLEPDTFQMCEYGGIYIERSDLERYANASIVLQNAETSGYEIREIIYRANGIVNVNLHTAFGDNRFLTFQLSGNEATDVTPTDNSGYYLLASNPSIAVYPSSMGEVFENSVSVTGKATMGKSLNTADGSVYGCDFDGDGSEEKIQLASDGKKYYLNIADANGDLIAQHMVFDETSAEYEHKFIVGNLDGDIYLEASYAVEGICTYYMVFKYENGSYVCSKWICDVDPSDGTEIRNELTNKVLYADETVRNNEGIISVLQQEFSEYNLCFRERSDDYTVAAVLSDERVICYLTDADIVKRSESTLTSEMKTTLNASQTSSSQGIFRATGNVNMRSEPNKNSNIVTTVSNGARGTYLGKSSTDSRGVVWYYVNYEGKIGWVSSMYAVIDGKTSAGSTNSSSNTSTSKASEGRFIVRGGKTNIRNQPNLNGEIYGVVQEGNSGEYLGKTSTDSRGVVWYKVRYNGVTGWISSKYAYLK